MMQATHLKLYGSPAFSMKVLDKNFNEDVQAFSAISQKGIFGGVNIKF